MRTHDIEILLNHNDLFVSLTDEQLENLIANGKTISITKDSFLVNEGGNKKGHVLNFKMKNGRFEKDPVSGNMYRLATLFPEKWLAKCL